MRRVALLVSLSATLGCLTHLRPQGDRGYLQVHWAQDFAAAQAQALAERKPLLVCLVSGALDGEC